VSECRSTMPSWSMRCVRARGREPEQPRTASELLQHPRSQDLAGRREVGASRSSRDAASPRYVVAVGEPASRALSTFGRRGPPASPRVVQHHLPGIQTMAALDLLMHPLQSRNSVDAVIPDQRVLPDRRLDRGIRFRTCILTVPPLVDVPSTRSSTPPHRSPIDEALISSRNSDSASRREQFDLVKSERLNRSPHHA